MKTVLNILFVTGFGWILGEKIGFMTAYFTSGFASILGLYLSWKIGNRMSD